MRFLRSLILLAVAGLLVISCSIAAFAQGGRATVSGRVTDSAGLAVVGARIQAINADTTAVSTTDTNDDGLYTIPSLPAGTYRIIVEKEGFEQVVRPAVELHVADNVAIAFTLQVGAVSQTVTVEGQAPVVNTTTSALGGLVDDAKIADLPLNGRNFIDLSLMQAGVAQNKNQGGGGGAAGTWFSANGAPVRSNYVTIDGASMITQLGGSVGSQAGTSLGVDGIKEYKVISHNYGAEYGMTMGSQMVIVSKGGTNQFHGSAFEYLRNSALDARNFFDTAATAGLNAAGQRRRLPPYIKDNFGGSFGGPIRKDKTFFFAVYEGLRQKLGVTPNDVVPAGNCHGPAGAVIWNGTGTQPTGSIGPCTQLGSNPSAGSPTTACPAVSNCVVLAPVIAPILALFPYDTTNLNSSTYALPYNNIVNDNFGQIRVDQNLTAADTLFGRYTIQQGTQDNGTAFPQYVRSQSPDRNQFLTVAENHIFSPTLLSTARLSFTRTKYRVHSQAAASMTSPAVSFVAGNPIGMVQITGLTGFGVGLGSGPNPDNIHVQNIYTLSDDLFYSRGKHALKFGVLINRFNQGIAAVQAPDGQIQFGSLAVFYTGVFGNYNSQTEGLSSEFDFIYNTYGFYVQDDYRPTSRLTLNLGLRYEFNTTPNDLNKYQASVRDYIHDAAATPGPLLDDKSYYNFSPRFGFAYDVFGNGKTAIKGGVGLLYDVGNIGNLLYQGVISVPPIQAQGTYNNTTNAVLGAQPFAPNPGLPTFGYAPGTASNNLHMANYYDGQPRMWQYNVTLEQLLPGGIGLSVAYVGSEGKNLIRAVEGNPYVPSSFVNGVPVWDPYVCAGVLSGYMINSSCLPNTTPNTPAGAISYVRRNPNYSSMIIGATGGSSWYDSLQVVANKRLSKGLEVQSAYTWSHAMNTTEGQGYSSDCSGTDMPNGVDPFDLDHFDKGPACWDIRQNWRFNVLYYLPQIHSNGLVSKFVNGWWMGTIVSMNTGYPFSAGEGANRAQSGLFTGQVIAERASINTAASIAANPCTSLPGQTASGSNPCAYTPIPFDPKTVYTKDPNKWINPAMFSQQPIGTLGNSARGLMVGPGLADWDFSLVKDTAVRALGEKGSVEFRTEIFNFPNHANFGSPSGVVFPGGLAAPNAGPYSQGPSTGYGKISATFTTSRQLQFSLRLAF